MHPYPPSTHLLLDQSLPLIRLPYSVEFLLSARSRHVAMPAAGLSAEALSACRRKARTMPVAATDASQRRPRKPGILRRRCGLGFSPEQTFAVAIARSACEQEAKGQRRSFRTFERSALKKVHRMLFSERSDSARRMERKVAIQRRKFLAMRKPYTSPSAVFRRTATSLGQAPSRSAVAPRPPPYQIPG